MSEAVRLGFCTDNIAGVLTLDSTIQSVSGNTSGGGTLDLPNFTVDSDGNTVIKGTLDVNSSTILRGDVTVLGTLTSGGSGGGGSTSINLPGASTLGSLTVSRTLDVSGTATVDSLLVKTGTTLQTLTVANSASVAAISVTGESTLNSTSVTSLTASGNSSLTTLGVSGTTTLTNLVVTGSTTIPSLTLPGNISLTSLTTGSLNATGATSLNTVTANSSTFSTVTVTGASNLDTLSTISSSTGSLRVTNNSTLNGLTAGNTRLTSLDISGRADISGALTVYGAATFLNPTGITFPNNNRLLVNSSGTLLVNGAAITGGSSSFPQDISGTTLSIGTGKMTVDSTGNIRSQGNVDISGNIKIRGNEDLSGTLTVYGVASFLNPSGITFPNNNSLLVNSTGTLLVNGAAITGGGTAVFPQDISGTTLSIGTGNVKIASSGNTDISGTLTVYGRTNFLDSSGIFLSNNTLNINSSGTLLVNGVPLAGSSGTYPQDITASSLDISSGKFRVLPTGQTTIRSSLDVTGITTLNGVDISGTRFNVYEGPTRVLYYDYVSHQTNINNLTLNPTGSFQAGSDGTNSLIQIVAGSPTINLINTRAANTVCYNRTAGGTALAVNNLGSGAINSTNPLVTIGNMTTIATLPNNPLLTNDLVLSGNMFIDGNITYTGTSSGQSGTGTSYVWTDISAAIASQFSGTGATSYLDVSAGITGVAGISGTATTTLGGFTGNYVPTTATNAEIIRTLNMIISNQNRIIAALLNRKTSGP